MTLIKELIWLWKREKSFPQFPQSLSQFLHSFRLGNPVHFLLTGGNIFDASAAIDLLSGVNISGSNILGDKAYGAKSIRAYIAEQGASYTIPPKSNVVEPWFCDFHTYKERHLIECFFNKLKVFRRVATRYDKLAVSFLAFVHLASIWILLK